MKLSAHDDKKGVLPILFYFTSYYKFTVDNITIFYMYIGFKLSEIIQTGLIKNEAGQC